MAFSVKVDQIAATFFRSMVREEAQIRNIVNLFMRDLEQEVSSEESFKTMALWQKFLKVMLGDISELTEDEVSELNKVLRMKQVEKCSMVTQGIANKYYELLDTVEEPMYKAYSLMLPRIDRF